MAGNKGIDVEAAQKEVNVLTSNIEKARKTLKQEKAKVVGYDDKSEEIKESAYGAAYEAEKNVKEAEEAIKAKRDELNALVIEQQEFLQGRIDAFEKSLVKMVQEKKVIEGKIKEAENRKAELDDIGYDNLTPEEQAEYESITQELTTLGDERNALTAKIDECRVKLEGFNSELGKIKEKYKEIIEKAEQDKKALVDEEKTPEVDPKALVDEEKTPEADPKALVDEEKTPEIDPKALVDEEKTPEIDETIPVDEEKTPEVDPKALVDEEKTPEIDPKTPVDEEKTPEVDPKTPVDEAAQLKEKQERAAEIIAAYINADPSVRRNVLVGKDIEVTLNGKDDDKESINFNSLEEAMKIVKADTENKDIEKYQAKLMDTIKKDRKELQSRVKASKIGKVFLDKIIGKINADKEVLTEEEQSAIFKNDNGTFVKPVNRGIFDLKRKRQDIASMKLLDGYNKFLESGKGYTEKEQEIAQNLIVAPGMLARLETQAKELAGPERPNIFKDLGNWAYNAIHRKQANLYLQEGKGPEVAAPVVASTEAPIETPKREGLDLPIFKDEELDKIRREEKKNTTVEPKKEVEGPKI